jgi:5-methylcytosine-specific restriction endonuclease McrA
MPSQSSRRSAPLPHNWPAIRLRVLRRDGWRCQLAYPDRCRGAASEVDHLIPATDGGTDAMSNLQAVCSPCHARKTGKEAAAHVRRYSRTRTDEKHPGLR